jgi:hypothetical protein
MLNVPSTRTSGNIAVLPAGIVIVSPAAIVLGTVTTPDVESGSLIIFFILLACLSA